MRVPGLILSDNRLMADIRPDASLEDLEKVVRRRPIGVVKG